MLCLIETLHSFRFMPRVIDAMNDMHIPVFSAQVEYGPRFPGKPALWKMHAFSEQLKFGDSLNLLSIGDANYERFASKAAYRRKDSNISICKTVKFLEAPSLDQLEAQLLALAQALPSLSTETETSDWNLRLDRVGPRTSGNEQFCAKIERFQCSYA